MESKTTIEKAIDWYKELKADERYRLIIKYQVSMPISNKSVLLIYIAEFTPKN